VKCVVLPPVSQSPLSMSSRVVGKVSSPATPRTKVSFDAPSTVRSGVYVCFDQTIGILDLDFVLGCRKAVESAGAGRFAAAVAVANVPVGFGEDVLFEEDCDAAAETCSCHAFAWEWGV
jgi:hypothetical protein